MGSMSLTNAPDPMSNIGIESECCAILDMGADFDGGSAMGSLTNEPNSKSKIGIERPRR